MVYNQALFTSRTLTFIVNSNGEVVARSLNKTNLSLGEIIKGIDTYTPGVEELSSTENLVLFHLKEDRKAEVLPNGSLHSVWRLLFLFTFHKFKSLIYLNCSILTILIKRYIIITK